MLEKFIAWTRNLFNNVGASIKFSAKVGFWLELIAAWLGGLFWIFFMAIEAGTEFALFLLLYPVYAVLCIFVAFSLNALLYAIGELVDGATASIKTEQHAKNISDYINLLRLNEENKAKKEKLDNLLKNNVITQEEYDRKIAE